MGVMDVQSSLTLFEQIYIGSIHAAGRLFTESVRVRRTWPHRGRSIGNFPVQSDNSSSGLGRLQRDVPLERSGLAFESD